MINKRRMAKINNKGQSAILSKKQIMMGLALLISSQDNLFVKAQTSFDDLPQEVEHEEFIQSEDKLSNEELQGESRLNKIRLTQIPFVTSSQQAIQTEDDPKRAEAKKIIEKGLQKRKNSTISTPPQAPQVPSAPQETASKLPTAAENLAKAFEEAKAKQQKEPSSSKAIEVEVKVSKDQEAKHDKKSSAQTEAISNTNTEDVDKSKITLKAVTPPNGQVQDSSEPVQAKTSKPKKNPFSLNITVNEDGDIKIDSTHPDIGTKTVSSDKVGVPKKQSSQDQPSKKAKDEFDLEFEPAQNGEIVTPSQEQPTVKKVTTIKKVSPSESSKPARTTESQPSSQGADDEPVVEDVAPKTKKIQPVEIQDTEPVLPKPAPAKLETTSNDTEPVTPTQIQPVEEKESIVVPAASSPAVKIPMKKVEADGSVSEPKFPSEDDPVQVASPKKKVVVIKQVPSKTVVSEPVVEEIIEQPTTTSPARQTVVRQVPTKTVINQPVVEEEVIEQPVVSSTPLRKTVIKQVPAMTNTEEQVVEEVIVSPEQTISPSRQIVVPRGQVTNSVAHVSSSKVSNSYPTQPKDFPELKPASMSTPRSISDKNKDNEEVLPMPANTEKQKKQGSLEAQSDEKKLKVMLRPGEKMPIKKVQKKKVVQKPVIQPVNQPVVKKEFEGDSQSEIPVVIKVHEDTSTPSNIPLKKVQSDETQADDVATPKVVKEVTQSDEVTQSPSSQSSSIKILRPPQKKIVNERVVPIETGNESYIKPNESSVSEPKETTIDTKNASIKISDGFDIRDTDDSPVSPAAKKAPYTKVNKPHAADPVIQPKVVKYKPLPAVDPTKPQVEPSAEQAGLPAEPLIVRQGDKEPETSTVSSQDQNITTKPATVEQDTTTNSTEPASESPVVKKVVKVTPKSSEIDDGSQVTNSTVNKVVVSDSKSKSGKKKKVIVKKVIKKLAPKKNVTVIKPNVTKVTNKTEEVDAILNDTEVVDKKNKIEYLENLEKDLEEATAKISKHKNELKIQKANKIISKLNATNQTLPGSTDALTPDNVDKALEESKSIIKDQEIKEAEKILERANSTIVDSQPVVKKIVKKVVPKEKVIETKDTSTVVNDTYDPDIVAPAVITSDEVIDTKDTATVIDAPKPAVEVSPVQKNPKAVKVRETKVPMPLDELKPHQKEPVPRASDSGSVWPAYAYASQSQPQSLGSVSGQVWDPAEVFKTFQKQIQKKQQTTEQKYEEEQQLVKKKLLQQKSIELENKMRNEQEIQALQENEDKQEDEAVKSQIDFDLAKITIKKRQMEAEKSQQELVFKSSDADTPITTLAASPAQLAIEKQFQANILQQPVQQQPQVLTQETSPPKQEENKQEEEQAAEALKKQDEINQAEKIKQQEQQALVQKQSAEAIKQRAEEQRIVKSKIESNYQKLRTKMNQEMDQFSVNLNSEHLQKAIDIQKEISSNQEFTNAGLSEPENKVHTSDVFKNSFTFPQIALNDFAQDQLSKLSKSESELNNNLQSQDQVKSFIETAKTVSKELQQRYKSQWINPDKESRKAQKAPDAPAENVSQSDEAPQSAIQDALQKKVESQALPQYESFNSINEPQANSRYAKDLEPEANDLNTSDLIQYMSVNDS